MTSNSQSGDLGGFTFSLASFCFYCAIRMMNRKCNKCREMDEKFATKEQAGFCLYMNSVLEQNSGDHHGQPPKIK